MPATVHIFTCLYMSSDENDLSAVNILHAFSGGFATGVKAATQDSALQRLAAGRETALHTGFYATDDACTVGL